METIGEGGEALPHVTRILLDLLPNRIVSHAASLLPGGDYYAALLILPNVAP